MGEFLRRPSVDANLKPLIPLDDPWGRGQPRWLRVRLRDDYWLRHLIGFTALCLPLLACCLRFDGLAQLEGIVLHHEGYHLWFRSIPPRFFSIPEAIFETG